MYFSNFPDQRIYRLDHPGLPRPITPEASYRYTDYDICTYTQGGMSHLASLDTTTLHLEQIETSYADIRSLRAALGRVLFIAGSSTETLSVILLDLATRQHRIWARLPPAPQRAVGHYGCRRLRQCGPLPGGSRRG